MSWGKNSAVMSVGSTKRELFRTRAEFSGAPLPSPLFLLLGGQTFLLVIWSLSLYSLLSFILFWVCAHKIRVLSPFPFAYLSLGSDFFCGQEPCLLWHHGRAVHIAWPPLTSRLPRVACPGSGRIPRGWASSARRASAQCFPSPVPCPPLASSPVLGLRLGNTQSVPRPNIWRGGNSGGPLRPFPQRGCPTP